ncbi:hypothetical protein CVU82_01270 [Candidatus Falkowbacteria bacterium HGW-Falkowbacteria-1]|uniref:Sortilin N-terminal domain-containing protein n=1 Tax=Candidatus Falkowbacteria bacterium HGW-Falkowbacteria-1 TaxID=2013768 RepID=A0A2N2EAV8_9BACT|nr:MAG: hypothetical protein CVU82_01270 [Candidatus Falkowbacteria bacterium HGW-Falkowbacteria-1]
MKKFKLLPVLFLTFFLGACSLNFKTSGVGVMDGGVFVTGNKGESWKQMSSIPSISGAPGSIANSDVNSFTIDPSDSAAIYLSSIGDGLYYTYNVGRGWNKALSLPGNITVNDVAVDNKDKCVIFVAMENKLYRSDDCSRNFSQVYYDNNQGVGVMAVALDHYNPKIVYMGTSRGDILRSFDGGDTWRAIQRLNDSVKKILINPKDSRSVFVATTKNGIYRFNSAGGASLEQLEEYKNQFDNTNWTDYNKELKEFALGVNFKDLVYSYSDNSLFLATDKVIVRSFDEGQSWIKISLLTPESDSSINAIAINPQNADEIFYVTDTSFYRSYDGGNTWSVKKLPSTRAGSSLLIDFNNPSIIYLGIKKIKK